jgi:hypothetical protein
LWWHLALNSNLCNLKKCEERRRVTRVNKKTNHSCKAKSIKGYKETICYWWEGGRVGCENVGGDDGQWLFVANVMNLKWNPCVFHNLKKISFFSFYTIGNLLLNFAIDWNFTQKKDWKWLQYTMYSWNCEPKLLSNVVEIRDWKRKNNKVGAWRQRKWKTWKHEFETENLKMKSLEVENTKQNIVKKRKTNQQQKIAWCQWCMQVVCL